MEGGITPFRADSRVRRHDSHQRPVRAASSVATFARLNLGRGILVHVLLCALPAMGLLAAGRARLAGICFWVLLGLTLLRLVLFGRHDYILCLLLSLAPLMDVLRTFATYNIIVPLFAMALFYHYRRSAGTVSAMVSRSRLVAGLFVYVSVYYLLSLIFTGDYSMNLRMFEAVFVVAGILILGRRGGLLRLALQGYLLSGWALGIAMVPHFETTDRLGMITVEGHILGNPVQLGVVLALSFLALFADRGRWLHLEDRPLLLVGSLVVTIALLYLTTSRGAWLVVAASTLVVIVFVRGQRLRVLLIVAMIALILPMLLLTPYASGVQRGLDRTFRQDRSLRSRTSGRSDQWVVAYSAFTESPSSLLYGYGPGMGPAVYARESLTLPAVEYLVGREAPLHSLFMQVAVEAGILGLAPVVLWCALILYRNIAWVRRRGEVLPLASFVGYLCIGLTVGAQGTGAGVFLGLALLASNSPFARESAIAGRPSSLLRHREWAAVGRTS